MQQDKHKRVKGTGVSKTSQITVTTASVANYKLSKNWMGEYINIPIKCIATGIYCIRFHFSIGPYIPLINNKTKKMYDLIFLQQHAITASQYSIFKNLSCILTRDFENIEMGKKLNILNHSLPNYAAKDTAQSGKNKRQMNQQNIFLRVNILQCFSNLPTLKYVGFNSKNSQATQFKLPSLKNPAVL